MVRDMHGVKLPRRLVFPHFPYSQLEFQQLGSAVEGYLQGTRHQKHWNGTCA